MKFSLRPSKKSVVSKAVNIVSEDRKKQFCSRVEIDDGTEGELTLLEIIGNEYKTEGGSTSNALVIPCKNRLMRLKQQNPDVSDKNDKKEVRYHIGLNLFNKADIMENNSEYQEIECRGDDTTASVDDKMKDLKKVLGMGPRKLSKGQPLMRNRRVINLQDELAELRETDYDDYDKIPIDEFGLAMLRGMGYDPELHKETATAAATKDAIGTKIYSQLYRGTGLGASTQMEENKRLLQAASGKK